jgi:hypothetical protein
MSELKIVDVKVVKCDNGAFISEGLGCGEYNTATYDYDADKINWSHSKKFNFEFYLDGKKIASTSLDKEENVKRVFIDFKVFGHLFHCDDIGSDIHEDGFDFKYTPRIICKFNKKGEIKRKISKKNCFKLRKRYSIGEILDLVPIESESIVIDNICKLNVK